MVGKEKENVNGENKTIDSSIHMLLLMKVIYSPRDLKSAFKLSTVTSNRLNLILSE